METKYHVPVMLKETLDYLNVKKNEKYIDCTLGDGGHTIEILKQGGKVLGLDFSGISGQRAQQRIAELGLEDNFIYEKANFTKVGEVATKHDFTEVSGILFDLGYSSYQLDEGEFGLSFLKNEELDMRLDKNLGVTAADLLNALPEKNLARIFAEFGEERYAKRFAKAIVKYRELEQFSTTNQLVELIRKEAPPGYDNFKKNPATRVFQALRIAVNSELENLDFTLPIAADLLKSPGGRMVVITFHSLEEKAVNNFGRQQRLKVKKINNAPILPTRQEVQQNRRSRSAKINIFEKI